MRNWNWLCWRLLCKKIFCSCFNSVFAPVNLCTAVWWYKSGRRHGILKAKQLGFFSPHPELKKDRVFNFFRLWAEQKAVHMRPMVYPVSQMMTSLPLWDYISSGSRFILLKLWNLWNTVCLGILKTFLRLKANLPVVSVMQVKPCFFMPFNWNLSHLLQGVHFVICDICFYCALCNIIKVPSRIVLTFKNHLKHFLGLFKLLSFKYNLCLIHSTCQMFKSRVMLPLSAFWRAGSSYRASLLRRSPEHWANLALMALQ